jgi:hypothetical protein
MPPKATALTFEGPLSQVPFLRPPPFFFFFFSSKPRPNILKSVFAGFVDAKKLARRINFDIRGNATILSTLTWLSLPMPTAARSSLLVRRMFSSGTFAAAQSAALASRGYRASNAVVNDGVNRRVRRILTSSVGGSSANSPVPVSFSAWRLCSSKSGWTNPGHRAADM